jgi:hypothetical protein
MPTVIAIVGVALLVCFGIVWFFLSQPPKDTGVYKSTELPKTTGRAKAR